MHFITWIHMITSAVYFMRTRTSAYKNDLDRSADRPSIIAHRGSSGIYPEHTSIAIQAAIDQGSDSIEFDLSITKDLELVCLHQSWMSGVSNVADVFPEDRMNTYFVTDNARFITDYFSVDFTLEEFKTIGARQAYEYRDQSFNDQYTIITLHELIDLVQVANRTISLFAEIKDPIWVNSLDIITQANTTFEQLIVDALASRGYMNETSPCSILSFNDQCLQNVAELTSLPLVVLLASSISVTDDDLEYYSTFAYALGVHKNLVVRVGLGNKITEITDLVGRAQSLGLRVFPWTARNEYHYLAFDYEQDPYLEYETLLSTGVDGIISDFPATLRRYLQTQ